MAHFNQTDRPCTALLKVKRLPAPTILGLPARRTVLTFRGLCVVGLLLTLPAMTKAQGVIGSIKGTVSATTNDPAARPARLANARVSLVNTDLNGAPVKSQ